MSATSRPWSYEICVEGVLDNRWAQWFEGLQVDGDEGRTVISGVIADQAALHGALNKVRDLGLCLLSVRRVDPERKGRTGDQ